MLKNKRINNFKNLFFLNIVFIIIILQSITIYSQDDINSYEYLKLEINNKINFYIDFKNNWGVETFTLKSHFFPQTFNNTQYLNEFETNNSNYVLNNKSNIYYLEFFYDKKNLQSNNEINNKFIIQSTDYRPQVKKKIKYPIENIDEKNLKYLEFINLIDESENIKNQASLLAQGQDDTFIIASKIAKWIIEDIEYDLTTIALNPNQKSSEVFESKKGVCKEISNLYISMLRSLGIPSRIVTGYAYSESEDIVDFVGSHWGGHAWVEVLIGDEWVPFDLTYNQYGFVDASHIVLDKSVHIRENSLIINTSGYGYSFAKQSTIDNNFEIIDKIKSIEKNKEGYNIDVSGPDEVAFGSYGYIQVDIENKDDFYQIIFLQISNINEINILNDTQKMIILRPKEKRTIYFKYKIKEDTLESGFMYTLPFLIYNENIEINYDVKVKEDFIHIKKINLPKEDDIFKHKSFSNYKLNVNCSMSLIDKSQNKIICYFTNPNNYKINDLNICLENTCKNINLILNERKAIEFTTNKFKSNISYSYDNVSDKIEVSMDMPILNLNYSLDGNKIHITSFVENYQKSMITSVYLNSQGLRAFAKNKTSMKLNLQPGINNITYELIIGNKILDKQTIQVNISDEINNNKDVNNNDKLGFFQKLINFFKSLF
ncbi:MAG: transglutaminase-like domain-containing protein [Nanoarchaeota archaeon]